ncbi:AEC family transporter [Herbaspirillum sp. DW155]|uniref:AEC family transporter n=1 Tax=Herbaspirillum sp. DW155 TaxID=3095609 RepID=UPI00308B363A|nr:AEC family transporter [Herbaspirillum sp. DW155]
MEILNLLLPDFSLIALGLLIYRVSGWGDEFWAGMEKLVYFILFPALLFYSTARLKVDLSVTGGMVGTGVAALVTGIALTWLGKPLLRATPMTYESGMQCAYRFNSYIALALATRMAGEEGAGLMAILLGFGVPLCNIAAVHALAAKNGNLLRELARNPLLVATAGGLTFSALGLHLPEVASVVLSRLGAASIALGLLMVGAGLRLSGLKESKPVVGWFLFIKLCAVPLAAYLIGMQLQLPPLQWRIVVLFCSLPTASSAYILAARMGGNGPFTAFLISIGTLFSALTIPVWLALVH